MPKRTNITPDEERPIIGVTATALLNSKRDELVRDLQQVLADYRVGTGHEKDDDYATNTLNYWISEFGGKRR